MASIASYLISDLPEDPNLSLLELRDRTIKWMEHDYDLSIEGPQIVAVIEAWHKTVGIKTSWKLPILARESESSDRLRHYLDSISKFERVISVETAASEAISILEQENDIRQKDTFGYAILREEEKAKIRQHIENIRKIISESEIGEKKRVSLLKKLSLLELDLERTGTSTDRFFAFMGDAAFALGDFANRARPFTHEVKEIMKIVLQGREDAEGVRLPKNGDDFLLPPPE